MAVARKLAMIMLTMIKAGELFIPNAGAAVKSDSIQNLNA